jgi:hypothetical protein
MKDRGSRLVAGRLAAALVLALCSTAGATPVPAATPWPWPAIPVCLADPSTQTLGALDKASPVCAVYDALLSTATDIELLSARRANAELDGILYPAFLPGTEVVRFVPGSGFVAALGAGNQLVRVSRSAAGARYGSWWTTLRQVSDPSGALAGPAVIRALLALTDSPTCVAYASDVARGVRAYMGVVAPAFDEPGGAVEFWFPPDAVVAPRTAPLRAGGGC